MSRDYDLPRDKYDTASAETLVSLGWEKVLPVMPDILEWLQDINWPVALIFRPFLIDVGAPLAPFIKAVLATDDNVWKYGILVNVVTQSPELAAELRSDLERLCSNPSAGEQLEGVSELAQEILAS